MPLAKVSPISVRESVHAHCIKEKGIAMVLTFTCGIEEHSGVIVDEGNVIVLDSLPETKMLNFIAG